LLYSRDRGETLTVLCAVAVNAEIEDEEEDGALKYVRLGAFTPLIVTHDGHVLVGASTRRRCYLQERVRRSSAQSVSGEQATGSCSAQRSGPRLSAEIRRDPAAEIRPPQRSAEIRPQVGDPGPQRSGLLRRALRRTSAIGDVPRRAPSSSKMRRRTRCTARHLLESPR